MQISWHSVDTFCLCVNFFSICSVFDPNFATSSFEKKKIQTQQLKINLESRRLLKGFLTTSEEGSNNLQLFSFRQNGYAMGAFKLESVQKIHMNRKKCWNWYLANVYTWHSQGWGFCGFFRICGFFFQCFQSSAFGNFLQFRAFRTLIREREMREKNAYKITLVDPQREMRKIAHKNIPNRASAPRTSKLWASCAVHTFILLTSSVLNGNNFFRGCIFCFDVISCWR